MATYKVATDGSGDFTTIAQVNAATFSPGDSILFKCGDVWNENLTITVNGSSGKQIVFGSFGVGNKPKLNCVNTSGLTTYFDIRGLHIRGINSNTYPLGIDSANNVSIDDCTVDANGVDKRYVRIVNIESSLADSFAVHIKNSTFLCNGSGGQYAGINVGQFASNFTHDITIEDNVITGGHEIGIQCYSNSLKDSVYNILIKGNNVSGSIPSIVSGAGHGINVGWYSKDVTVENNYVFDNDRYGIVVDTGVDDVLIKNNVCINNLYNIGTEGAGKGTTNNIEIYNNTSVGGSGTDYPGIRFAVTEGGDNYSIKNNLIIGDDTSDYFFREGVASLTNIVINNNCYYNSQSNTYKYRYHGVDYNSLVDFQATGQDLDSLETDAKISNVFYLQTDSPCFNAGEPLTTVTDDYFGLTRPSTSNTIGALQYPEAAYIQQGEIMSTYSIPNINNKPPHLADMGFYADVRFDPDDSAPDYIGLNLDNGAAIGSETWKVYHFTYSTGTTKVTRIQLAYGAWSNRVGLFS